MRGSYAGCPCHVQRHGRHFHPTNHLPAPSSMPARSCPRPRAAPAAAAVFTSTWLGSVTMGMGEYIIRRLPLVKHIYSAAKQVGCSAVPGRVQCSEPCSKKCRRSSGDT
jgi:hypothetical protein